MKTLIKLLGGYSKDEYEQLQESNNATIVEYERKLVNECKKSSKYYMRNRRAVKYLKDAKVSNMWKTHHKKVLELLE
jgi:hypothetical protein